MRENTDTGTRRMVGSRRTWRRGAFTLTELLVVMGLLSLLTSVLWPAVPQAGRHARAVACQSQLRQWSLAFAMFVEDNEQGAFCTPEEWESFCLRYTDGPRRTLLLCPMATRNRINGNDPQWEYAESINCGLGSKFTAWKLSSRNLGTTQPGPVLGSYGVNGLGLAFLDTRLTRFVGLRQNPPSGVPLVVDSVCWYPQPGPLNDPPEYDGALTTRGMKEVCIDRHGGGINSLFLDGSVRKVGLKELWMLRWSLLFDIRGPWTKAGGVQPEDWPAWMRAFKDY